MKTASRLSKLFAIILAAAAVGSGVAQAQEIRDPQAPPALPILVSVNITTKDNALASFLDSSPYKSLSPLSGSPFFTNSNSQAGAFITSQIAQTPGTSGSWCTYVADSLGTEDNGNTDIAVFRGTLSGTHLVENFYSSEGLSGIEYGVGLSISGGYLYANYTGSVVIEVLKIDTSTCKLTDTGNGADSSGPFLNMATGITAHGSCLFASYADGSVGSYKIGGGTISSYVSQVYTNGYNSYGGVPGRGIVTSDGYVLYDDSYSTGVLYDAMKIGTGCALTLANDRVSGPYGSVTKESSNFVLAPDGSTIYTIGNTGTIQTDHYSGSGLVTETSCEDVAMSGYNTNFKYTGAGATPTTNGAGNGLFVAETGGGSGSYIGAFPYSNGCLQNGGQFQTYLEYTNALGSLVTLAQPSE